MNCDSSSLIQSKDALFGDVIEIVTDKISASEISLHNYISTENIKEITLEVD